MKASEYYKTKPVNIINQERKGNLITVKIFRHEWKQAYQFKAKNFGERNEQILEDEDVTDSKD